MVISDRHDDKYTYAYLPMDTGVQSINGGTLDRMYRIKSTFPIPFGGLHLGNVANVGRGLGQQPEYGPGKWLSIL